MKIHNPILFSRLLKDETLLYDTSVPFLDKHFAYKDWLHIWERENLPTLREMEFRTSEYVKKLTLVVYCFWADKDDFDFLEFAILHTWRLLGRLPVVIVADRRTGPLADFAAKYQDVFVRISSTLEQGSVPSMSRDCLMNLYTYFTTPYCLVLQDDGFPIRDNIDDFLGKWDYIGAPAVGDTPLQYVADMMLRDTLNGGFSLRSRRYCQAVARNWRLWGNRYARLRGLGDEEDFHYSCLVRLNPWVRLRYRLPNAVQARRFSFFDLLGTFDACRLKCVPFGVHGQSTVWQYRKWLETQFGYKMSLSDLEMK